MATGKSLAKSAGLLLLSLTNPITLNTVWFLVIAFVRAWLH